MINLVYRFIRLTTMNLKHILHANMHMKSGAIDRHVAIEILQLIHLFTVFTFYHS